MPVEESCQDEINTQGEGYVDKAEAAQLMELEKATIGGGHQGCAAADSA